MGLVLNAFDNYCNKVTLRQKNLVRIYLKGYAGN